MSQPHLDEKVVWKGLEKLRKDSIKSESSYKCISLIEAKDIDHNFINLSKYLNVSTSSDEIKNLSKLVIENGSKKFHYLNGCQNKQERDFWGGYYDALFTYTQWNSQPTKLILSLYNTIKKANSSDGRIIAKKLLKDLFNKLQIKEGKFELGDNRQMQKNESRKIHTLDNHPVHIFDNNQDQSPSAFIPFCSFGNDMNDMGVKMEEFKIPVCNSFKEIIRNDQLCYEIDLEKFKKLNNIQDQLQTGLILVLDLNEERQFGIHRNDTNERERLQILGSNNKNDVEIHLDTISKKYLCVYLYD